MQKAAINEYRNFIGIRDNFEGKQTNEIINRHPSGGKDAAGRKSEGAYVHFEVKGV